MSQKRVKMFQIESLRLSINEHMASVREDISCVVNERLSSVEQFMCSLFQSEIETLATLLERQDTLLDVLLQPHVKVHGADQCVESSLQVKMSSPQPSRTVSVKLEPEDHLEPEDQMDTNFLHLPVYIEEVSPEQQERSSGLVQEEPEPPHIKEEQEEILQRPEEADGSALTLLAVKSEVNPGIAGASTMPAVQANPAADPSMQLRMSASAVAGPYRLLLMPPTADPATRSWSQPPPPPCVLLPQPIRNTPATFTTTMTTRRGHRRASSVKPAIAGPSSWLKRPTPATAGPSTRSWPQFGEPPCHNPTLCKLCGRPAQRHRKHNKKHYCPVGLGYLLY